MKIPLLKTFLICIISIYVNNSFSQTGGPKTSDDSQSKYEVKNSLKNGQWALMFGIGSDFNLTNFDDALVALKYNFSSKSALRLDFNLDYYNLHNTNRDYSKGEEQNYGGNLSFLYYLNPKSQFNIYLSLGINYSYHLHYNDDRPNLIYVRRYDWLLGPKIGAGAEFFVFESMSLFAEYNYIFGFGEEKTVINNNGSVFDSGYLNITSFAKNNVKFGLSVYF